MTGDPEFTSIRLADTDEAPSCPPGGGERAEAQRELATLLAAAATGNRDAFTRFYRATSARVFGLALRILRNRSAAEEVTQEVYLQAWTAAERYDAALASPIGWLMMLTHRRAVDRVRTEQSATVRDRVFGHAHLGRDHDTVAETVGQRLEEQAVLHCLDTLTATQREAVALAYYSGRTYREVAEHLDAPLPTVKSRIRDALKRLQNCLSGVASHA
ncbi:ECF RNA polymerase sigma factor SigK [Nocardia cerradoensis]|uniref:ECF RNA polymerase sigma factor SigK n=1 Tax=Nocardia cerradoensis TaxID=85688 RepID=UPI0002DD2DE6|nr:ECF RNA polymerase sigma factor SigK [Nocardia cerradoensis]NKY46821.1 ECF RNA polymerase sigma factor SigK [Nocardia cerradoensis]